jgi:hypothetical protein
MKKIIVFIALITIVINAFGQIPDMETFVNELTDSGNVYTQKVQQWNNDTLIVLSQEIYSNYCNFYLIDELHNATYQVILPSSDTVKDFKIFNDTIWFCGSLSSPYGGDPLGFIAYASLGDLFGNNAYYLKITKPMFSVDKFEMCIDPNTHHTIICGIGKAQSMDPYLDCFLYYDRISDSAFVFLDTNSSSFNEIFDDIIIKQDYSDPNNPINSAFIVGRSTIAQNNAILGIRQFDISNPYNNAGSYTNLSLVMQGYYFHDPLVADSLIGNYIAVAGVTTNNTSEEIDIFKIDVLFPQVLTVKERLFSEPYPIGEISIKDLMLYNGFPSHKYQLLALGNGPIFPNQSIYNFTLGIYFNNYTFHSNTDVYFSYIKILFNSFTKNNMQSIISTGVSLGNNIINTFKINPFNIHPNNCYNVNTLGMHKMDIAINPFSLPPFVWSEKKQYVWEIRYAKPQPQHSSIICH